MFSDETRPPSALAPQDLRRLTGVRVLPGTAGAGIPTKAQQRFLLDHARAREAVWTEVDWPQVRGLLEGGGLAVTEAESLVRDRAEYLRRPDLARRLSDEARERLGRIPQPTDLAIVIADGLSATAVTLNAAPLALRLHEQARAVGWSVAPVVLARKARVALGARAVVLLVSERPGLSAADSLGAYVTFNPALGTPDSRRNCISNIREGGLLIDAAVRQIADLLRRIFDRGRSGVTLARMAERPAIQGE